MAYWQEYQQPNLGLLFFKQIYTENDILELLATNEKDELFINVPKDAKTTPFDKFYTNMYNTKGSAKDYIEPPLKDLTDFNLYTTYPGLLCGTGYGHDTKAKGDFKIGFFFDHTTGQPILPGSSVKGVLRSLFELDVDAKGNEQTGEKSLNAVKFIFNEALESYKDQALKNKLNKALESLDQASLNTIKDTIFGGQDQIGADIFFDAVINFKELGNKKFLSNDFITPHQPNLLKNPIPLMFLKVLPNVPFQFRFKLSAEGWEADVKEALFKTILLTIGAGAKTNVGYGQFNEQAFIAKVIEPKSNDANSKNSQGGRRGQGNRNQPTKPIQTGPGLKQNLTTNLEIPAAVKDQIKKANYGKIKRGDEVYGQVIKSDRKFFFVQILIEENQTLLTKVQQSKKFKNLAVATVLHLKVTNLTNNDKLDCSIIKKIIE